jgi:hypothetical protein
VTRAGRGGAGQGRASEGVAEEEGQSTSERETELVFPPPPTRGRKLFRLSSSQRQSQSQSQSKTKRNEIKRRRSYHYHERRTDHVPARSCSIQKTGHDRTEQQTGLILSPRKSLHPSPPVVMRSCTSLLPTYPPTYLPKVPTYLHDPRFPGRVRTAGGDVGVGVRVGGGVGWLVVEVGRLEWAMDGLMDWMPWGLGTFRIVTLPFFFSVRFDSFGRLRFDSTVIFSSIRMM